ncbi:MAG TPA: MotA/TolQ/ExbB proton channel family protein [Cytophagaceae bacterium]|jgi:biopolymer transport protein ExbB|nr:MotA/TolQ/ExbB proton channel family protein [Cytophagaceae bacterium]
MNSLFILLQIVSDTSSSAQVVNVSSQEISLLDLLLKGGYVMIPILLLSLISVYLFIERYLYIKKTGNIDPYFITNINRNLSDGNIQGAISYCNQSDFTIAKMLQKGLYRLGSPMRDIESAIEYMANVEIAKMEKNISFLSAIAAIAPMLGFLGTVTGMIKSFYAISISDNISISIIAGGIYEKMVTSGAGLVVGILAHVFSVYLNNMIDRTINDMEIKTIEFLDILYKPQA